MIKFAVRILMIEISMKKIIFAVLAVFALVSCKDMADPNTYLAVSTNEVSFPADVSETEITVSTNVTPWTVSSDASWLEVSTDTGDSDSFMIFAEDNVGSSAVERTATVTVAAGKRSVAIKVTQLAVKDDDTPSGSDGSVTVMYYSVGGGNLDYKQVWKMRQCVSFGTQDWFNMTFQYKFSKTVTEGLTGLSDYVGVYRMDLADATAMKNCTMYPMSNSYIEKNFEGMPFKRYSEDASYDFTDPDALADFIRWSAELHPADKYILIIADHGGGWNIITDGVATKAILFDDNRNREGFSAKAIAEGINKSGVTLDVLYDDACEMFTLENIYEYKTAPVKYFVASMEDSYGGNYERMLGALSKNHTDLYAAFKNYADLHIDAQEGVGHYVDLSVIDLTKVDAVLTPALEKVVTLYKDFSLAEGDALPSFAWSSSRSAICVSSYNIDTPIAIAKAVSEIYGASYRTSSDGKWGYISMSYILLLRQNHPDIWEEFSEEDRDAALLEMFKSSSCGICLADALKEFANFNDEVKAEFPEEASRVKSVYDGYLAALKNVSYIRCTEETFADQAYIECSPSVNLMALNEKGWVCPDYSEESYYDVNATRYATFYTLDEAIARYSSCNFDKEIGWSSYLKLNPYNTNLLSNPTREMRYSKK